MFKFCQKCGYKIPDISINFCPNCGHSFTQYFIKNESNTTQIKNELRARKILEHERARHVFYLSDANIYSCAGVYLKRNP